MRPSGALSLLFAAAGSQVAAQSTTSSTAAAPSTSISAAGPVTGKIGNATVVETNPPGVVYQATFPDNTFFPAAYPGGGNIKGTVRAVANPDGIGVLFKVQWSNLPASGGPFLYHIHVAPVPDNGNCTATLAHLDPFVRGEDPACDKSLAQTCQAGDLSGKHGTVPVGQTTFEASYVDLFASTVEGLGSFFGNRSIVFHYANKTRISCANFEKVAGGAGDNGASATESACSSTGATATGFTNLTSSAGATPTSGGPTVPSGGRIPVSVSAGSSLHTGVTSIIALAAAIAFML